MAFRPTSETALRRGNGLWSFLSLSLPLSLSLSFSGPLSQACIRGRLHEGTPLVIYIYIMYICAFIYIHINT